MKNYSIYIKSHTGGSDYESTIFAENRSEAKRRVYNQLQGEYSMKDINKFLVEEKV